MKICSNCGAQIEDDSRFCVKCGSKCGQTIVCPHCGAETNEGDVFCKKCGKNLTEKPISEPIYYYDEDKEKSEIKKYLPYIIGAIILLSIIGYFLYDKSSYDDKSALVETTPVEAMPEDAIPEDTSSVETVNDSPSSSEQEIQAKISFLENFYKELKEKEWDSEASEDYVKQNATSKVLSKLREWFEYDCYDDDCLATYLFFDFPAADHSFISRTINAQNENTFIIINKFDSGTSYLVQLNVIKDGDTYKIDDIELLGIDEMDDISENEEISSDSPYAKYIGRWTLYITYEGQRGRVYTAIINRDLTCEDILYGPDGSVKYSESFSQCVFSNGYAYFTNDGVPGAKGSPRYRLGPDGLQSASGKPMVKE